MLYKYRGFENRGRVLKMITEGEIWFASPGGFNDPFDMAIHYDYNTDIKTYRKWLLDVCRTDNPNANRQQRRMIIDDALRKFRRKQFQMQADLKRHHDATILKSFGVCCMAEPHDDILMWAHYAQNHAGICVGFDTNDLIETCKVRFTFGKLLGFLPITYAEEMPLIPFYEYSLKRRTMGAQEGFRLLTTKSAHWGYEREVRLLSWQETDFTLRAGREAVREVYLGCRVNADDKREVLEALERVGSTAAVYQARTQERRFALAFDKIR